MPRPDVAAPAWPAPPLSIGAVSGLVVVLGFAVVHDLLISDIWFNIGPMLFSGAICGLCVAWSYRQGVVAHSTGAWFRYAGLYVAEMVALGGVSLLVLRPRFTMAELIVADDALERLMAPSAPLMLGAMVVGTILFWFHSGRRREALLPIAVTQVLLVFLLGHQFAFLGLVEASTTLLRAYGEFALITAGLAGVFCVLVMGSTMALRPRRS